MCVNAPALVMGLQYIINNGREASAVNPASIMREFFKNFLDNSARVLLLISILVTVVAGDRGRLGNDRVGHRRAVRCAAGSCPCPDRHRSTS